MPATIILARDARGNLHPINAGGHIVAPIVPSKRVVALQQRAYEIDVEVKDLRQQLTMVLEEQNEQSPRTLVGEMQREEAELSKAVTELGSRLSAENEKLKVLEGRLQIGQALEQRLMGLRSEETVLREKIAHKGFLSPERMQLVQEQQIRLDALKPLLDSLTALSEAERIDRDIQRVQHEVVAEKMKGENLLQRSNRSSNSRRSESEPRGDPDVQALLAQIRRLEHQANNPEMRKESTERLRQERAAVAEAKKEIESAGKALHQETAASRAMARLVSSVEEDAFIFREQMCNDIHSLTLAVELPCTASEPHTMVLSRLTSRLGDYVDLVSDMQRELSNVVAAAGRRGIPSSAAGPYNGHKDGVAMNIAVLETERTHLRSLIHSLKLRQQEILRGR